MTDPESDELVLLCTCVDGMQAQAVRASLEARRIRVFVQGQQTSDVLGFIHAGLAPPRVMVPAADLAVATAIAEDTVGPLEGPGLDEPEERLDDPMRPVPEEDWSDEPEDDEAPEDALPPKRKNLGVILLLAFLGLTLGLGHIYAGRSTIGLVLLVVAVFGIFLTIGGNPLGMIVVGCVWIVDAIGGVVGVLAYNRELDRGSAGSR